MPILVALRYEPLNTVVTDDVVDVGLHENKMAVEPEEILNDPDIRML